MTSAKFNTVVVYSNTLLKTAVYCGTLFSLEIAWAHAPSTTPYDATYMPGSEADQRMDNKLEDQSNAIDFQQSSEKFFDYAYLLY